MSIFTRVILALAAVPLVTHAAANDLVPQATAPAQAGVEAIVARIRQDVQRIEALRLNAGHRIELEGFSLEGGEARVFMEGGQVVKITATHLGESGRTLETLYFRGGSLIFAFRRSMRYDRLHGRVQSTEEDRFYFDRNRMVRWLGGGRKLVPRAHARYAEEEADNLRFAAQVLAAARSRARTLTAPE